MFHQQGRNTAAYFTGQGLTLSFTQPSAQHVNSASSASPSRWQSSNRWNLKLDFIGADPAVRPEGKQLTPTQVSYFSEPPRHWPTGLRMYAAIAYRDLWPGIDLIYSGTVNRLKCKLMGKLGADLRQTGRLDQVTMGSTTGSELSAGNSMRS